MDSQNACSPPADVVSAAPVIATAAAARAHKPRRRRRWLIVLSGLLILLTIPVAGFFYLAWQRDRELDAAIAEVDATDPDWRWDDLMAKRPEVPDAENPTLLAMKVDALLRPSGYDVGQKNWPLFEKA